MRIEWDVRDLRDEEEYRLEKAKGNGFWCGDYGG